jgi:hypothetical protein
VENLNLAVAVRPGPDADGRDRKAPGDFLRHGGGDQFQDDGESASGFERLSIRHERCGGRRFAALDARAAHGMRRLRREAKMPAYRDAGANQTLHRGRNRDTTFDLHGTDPAFRHQAGGIA